MSFDASRGVFFCFHFDARFAVVTFADGLVWVGGIINFYGILIATSHGASIFSVDLRFNQICFVTEHQSDARLGQAYWKMETCRLSIYVQRVTSSLSI